MTTVVKILAGIPLTMLIYIITWAILFLIGGIVLSFMNTSSNIYQILNISRYLIMVVMLFLAPYMIMINPDFGKGVLDKVIGK